MPKTNCPACGGEVDIVVDVDTGETLPVEINTDASGEADRYRYVGFVNGKGQVKKVSPEAAGDFHPDHRFDCKDFNAGHTF